MSLLCQGGGPERRHRPGPRGGGWRPLPHLRRLPQHEGARGLRVAAAGWRARAAHLPVPGEPRAGRWTPGGTGRGAAQDRPLLLAPLRSSRGWSRLSRRARGASSFWATSLTRRAGPALPPGRRAPVPRARPPPVRPNAPRPGPSRGPPAPRRPRAPGPPCLPCAPVPRRPGQAPSAASAPEPCLPALPPSRSRPQPGTFLYRQGTLPKGHSSHLASCHLVL